MKFTELVKGAELKFEVVAEKTNTTVNIEIPEYGHWKRGAFYKTSELNEVVIKKLKNKNLVPQFEEGVIHAQKTNSVDISLEYKTNNKTTILTSKKN